VQCLELDKNRRKFKNNSLVLVACQDLTFFYFVSFLKFFVIASFYIRLSMWQQYLVNNTTTNFIRQKRNTKQIENNQIKTTSGRLPESQLPPLLAAYDKY